MLINNENLRSVLNYIKKVGLDYDPDEWIRVDELTEFYINTMSHRITINIALVEDEVDYAKDPNGLAFYIYSNKFIFVHFFGINHFAKTCESKNEAAIRSDIESEEEFFQESCVENLLSVEYSNYQLVKEIIEACDGFLWSS
jgi:hypothetical protein